MRMKSRMGAVAWAAGLWWLAGAGWAGDGPTVVPERERQVARDIAAEGPKANRGVESVTRLGGIAIGGEFPGAEGKELRARELLIAPGGVIAVHRHESRPGLAYILEGEIVEHRNDAERPLLRRAGEVSFEKTGVIHWWENVSDAPVRALVVDIVDVAPAHSH
jgi:quercetin dioxygenase-like cupin family protein